MAGSAVRWGKRPPVLEHKNYITVMLWVGRPAFYFNRLRWQLNCQLTTGSGRQRCSMQSSVTETVTQAKLRK